MVDRIELAKQYLQELRVARDDIVGSFVGGSVARGDWSESSDIDLVVLTSGSQDNGAAKGPFWANRSLATWREGVFIESAPRPLDNFSNFDEIMHDTLAASHMRDALILYDAAGVLTEMQKRVRAEFMEPRWIRVRIEPLLNGAREGLESLRETLTLGTPRLICAKIAGLTTHLIRIALLQKGISTSSARLMSQLADSNKELSDLMSDLEGSLYLDSSDTPGIANFTTREIDIIDPERSSEMFVYFDIKISSMVKKALLHDLVDFTWRGFAFLPSPNDSTPEVTQKADTLAEEWLRTMGWHGEEIIEGKIRLAEAILRKVEATAADLPPIVEETSS